MGSIAEMCGRKITLEVEPGRYLVRLVFALSLSVCGRRGPRVRVSVVARPFPNLP
jgi:hypothetical protein